MLPCFSRQSLHFIFIFKEGQAGALVLSPVGLQFVCSSSDWLEYQTATNCRLVVPDYEDFKQLQDIIVNQIHAKGVAHRDIKLSNFFRTEEVM